MIEPGINRYRIIERREIYSPPGVRFRDPALGTIVRDGLIVTVHQDQNFSRPIVATPTNSGVYAFHGLPNLHDITETSPSGSSAFFIRVTDKMSRYLPMVFIVDSSLVDEGILFDGLSLSNGQGKISDFYLFSAPTRTSAPGVAVVRGDLKLRANGRPASHAVVELQVEGEETWYAVADERGCFTLLFPCPAYMRSSVVSPPMEGSADSLWRKQWDLTVRVLHEPEKLIFPNKMKVPFLHTLFNQSKAQIWETISGSRAEGVRNEDLSVTLSYGQDLILHSQGQSESVLWIDI